MDYYILAAFPAFFIGTSLACLREDASGSRFVGYWYLAASYALFAGARFVDLWCFRLFRACVSGTRSVGYWHLAASLAYVTGTRFVGCSCLGALYVHVTGARSIDYYFVSRALLFSDSH